jgi:acetyl esterase/lipase
LLGGESAGAHLSLVVLLRTRARYGGCPFTAANLVYGAYDLRLTPSSATWGDRNLVLSTPIIEWFANNFVGDRDRSDPDISPLFADLANLPPTLLSAGTLDPLLDDSLFLHARLAAAGNSSRLAIYPGGIHGFDAFPTPLGTQARKAMDRFLLEQASLG